MKTNFQSEYSGLFARLGFPLGQHDGVPETELAEAENKLGICMPQALKDYYLVAGNEKVLNHSFNRLCRPDDWEVHSGKLIFFEENQTVVVWGVSETKEPAQDPLVYQCPLVRGELDKWYSQETCCSNFLKFMIHLQAAYGGGMPFTASGPAPEDLAVKLRLSWSFGGENGGMQAYSIQNRVVCLMKCRVCPGAEKEWRLFGGAKTKDELTAVAAELEINWDWSFPKSL